MRPSDQTETFRDVVCKKETSAALLCEIAGTDYWIPKSHVSDDSEVFDDADNASGKLVISEWIAKQKGLV